MAYRTMSVWTGDTSSEMRRTLGDFFEGKGLVVSGHRMTTRLYHGLEASAVVHDYESRSPRPARVLAVDICASQDSTVIDDFVRDVLGKMDISAYGIVPDSDRILPG